MEEVVEVEGHQHQAMEEEVEGVEGHQGQAMEVVGVVGVVVAPLP